MKDVDALIHQVNCLCVTPYGITQQLAQNMIWGFATKFVKYFPWANIYSSREGDFSKNLARPKDRGIPGTIRVFTAPDFKRPDIICFLSQWDYGTVDRQSRHIPPYCDTQENRKVWFRQCLEQLRNLDIKSVGIRYHSGSVGDWKPCLDAINDFAKSSDIHFVIISPSISNE